MKRCSFLLLMLVLAILLAGCHGSRGLQPFVPPEEFDESRTYELTFWAKNDTNKAQTKIYEQAIADFQALYPNIHITLRLYTDYGKIYNDVITNISTGTTPNVCITYPDHIATYLTGPNCVAPLDALFSHPRYGLGGRDLPFTSPSLSQIVPQFLKECIVADGHYAIPFMRSTEACYVNKTFVEALGYSLPDVLTWDFVWEVSQAAAAQESNGTYLLNGQSVMIPFLYKSTDNMMIQMLHQRGAGYAGADGAVEIFNPVTREILNQVAQSVEAGAFSTFKISSYPANFLNAGQCVFAVDSTAGATWMGSNAPLSDISEDQVVSFETAVRPIPQYDPDHPSMISQGPSICVFNKADPQEVLASWLFAQFLLTDSVQLAYAQTEGYVPVTTSAQSDPDYLEYLSLAGTDDAHYPVKIQASQLLLDHLEDTFVTPVFNGSASLRDAAGQMIESVAKSVKRKETIDDTYYQALKENMVSLYRLGQQSATAAGIPKDLGPLPPTAVGLLVSLAAAWCGLLLLWLGRRWQKKRTR